MIRDDISSSEDEVDNAKLRGQKSSIAQSETKLNYSIFVAESISTENRVDIPPPPMSAEESSDDLPPEEKSSSSRKSSQSSGEAQDLLLNQKIVRRMKGIKHKIVNSQIFEKAANLGPYSGTSTTPSVRLLRAAMNDLDDDTGK